MNSAATTNGVWTCSECGRTVLVSYEDLALTGPPLCMDEDCDGFQVEMELHGMEA